jgi:anti-sigma regulatory factor (Ser/Thr protein kinase)
MPKDDPFYGVARLVVGGLATRLDFSYEHLEDIQLALDSVLSNETYIAGQVVSVELRIRDDGLELRAGPVSPALRADLERDVSESEGIGLGRLLSTVAEDVGLESVEGGDWLRLEKRLPGKTVSQA